VKFKLEGDPTEIASFLQHVPRPDAPDIGAIITSMVNEIDATRRRSPSEYHRGRVDGLIEAVRITQGLTTDLIRGEVEEPHPPSQVTTEDHQEQEAPSPSPTPTPSQIVEPDYPSAGRQPAIKDRITQFLESRGKAKIGEISAAIGVPTSKLSPRVSELANDGFLVRHTSDSSENVYEFQRHWSQRNETTTKEAAPKPDSVSTRGSSLKESIVNFLVGYGEATVSEIAEYHEITDQAVRSRTSELVKDGFVERIDREDGTRAFKPIRDWSGQSLETDTSEEADEPKVDEPKADEPKADEPKADEPKADEPKAAAKPKRGPSQKTMITDFLSEVGPVESRVVCDQFSHIQRKIVQARLAELSNDGFVERTYDENSRVATWRLIKAYEPHQKVSVEDREDISPEHLEQLRIMGALADKPNLTYVELEAASGLSRSVLSKHLMELEKEGLVERTGQNPITFEGRPPNRKNQNPPPINSLNEAVLSMVRERPGQTSLQMAIRMMKSWSEVARRLHDLQKTVVECRVEEGHERYYPRA
jgi:DNA-binding HxlR family transcriptional regulator